MIKFKANLIVDHIDDKSVMTKSGEPYEFTEVTLFTSEQKPVWLVARLAQQDMKFQLLRGEEYACDIMVTSFKGEKGIWNRFLILSMVALNPQKVQDAPAQESAELPADDFDLPF